jgi:SPOR domain
MKLYQALEPSHLKIPSRGWALSFSGKRRILTFFIGLVLLLSTACSNTKSHGERVILDWDHKETGSNKVAVLPFENKTESEDLEKKVRESFYKHFSSKNYQDTEINEIDRALEIVLHNSSKSWRDLSPQSLGSLFQADYIITGEVLDFNKYFLGVYSQISLTVAVEIVRCQDGKKVWETILTERSHDGSVPFGLIGVIPAAVRSGVHLLDEPALDLIERTNRKLTAQIPDPTQPMTMASPFFVELQVASFQDLARAEKTRREIEKNGFNSRIETAMLDDRKWHRVILGPYFKVKDAETAREKIKQDWPFQPIYIHHYPSNTNNPKSKTD